jgi:hypothetical protein
VRQAGQRLSSLTLRFVAFVDRAVACGHWNRKPVILPEYFNWLSPGGPTHMKMNTLKPMLLRLATFTLATSSLFGCAVDLDATEGELNNKNQAMTACVTPALGEGAFCDLGDGDVQLSVTLQSGQAYVEVFARTNGIQNVATNIVGSGVDHGDGSTTYTLTREGYSPADLVEYRFYSYLPASPGVFTPGPVEQEWLSVVVGAGAVDVPVLKDPEHFVNVMVNTVLAQTRASAATE